MDYLWIDQLLSITASKINNNLYNIFFLKINILFYNFTYESFIRAFRKSFQFDYYLINARSISIIHIFFMINHQFFSAISLTRDLIIYQFVLSICSIFISLIFRKSFMEFCIKTEMNFI